MTEAEWLACNDPEEMYWVIQPLKKNSRRRMDLFCLACADLVIHLIEDEDAKKAFEWLNQHPGYRPREFKNRFRGPALALYDAHHRREPGVSGLAVHVAYDFWADWYEYAFPNLSELFTVYPGALSHDPRSSLPAIIRDIFGDPFRPVTLNPLWQTSTAKALADAIYTDRAFDRLLILADALEEAGCTDADILNHCRQPGEHVRGCWVVDLLLGKK